MTAREHHSGACGFVLCGCSSNHCSRGLLEVTSGIRFMPVLPLAVIRQYSSLKISLLVRMVKSSLGRNAASKSA